MLGVCCTHFEGGDCQAIQGHCADGCAWEEAAWERLAAYEDTGLKPEEVTQIKLAIMGKSLAEIKEFEGVSIDRMIELTQAEKDGRLVVLPDAKYTDADGEKALQTAMWTCGNTNNPVTRYTADAIAEKLCREARDKNPPLTQKELQWMDGEPVWIVQEGRSGRWDLIRRRTTSGISTYVHGFLAWADCGKIWRAYRYRLEPSANEEETDGTAYNSH